MLPVAQSILRNLFGLSLLFDESPTATPIATTTPVPEATPVPVTPTPLPTPSPWSLGQWFKTTGWSSDFHTVFLMIYLVIAITAVIVYFYLRQRRFKDHALHARLADRVSLILTAFATVGLLLLVFALAKIPLLSAPLWLILSLVALIAAGIYGIYYYVTVYPAELARYQREQERARYLPKGRTKGPAYTPPMKRKQKQGKQDKKKRK